MGRRGPKPRMEADGILEVAEATFARNGYGETSLRQLIAETGVSSTAFYARYDSKEAVLAALVSRLITRLTQLGSQIFQESRSLEQMFQRVPQMIVDGVRPHRGALQIALSEGLGAPSVRVAFERAFAGLAQLIATYLRRQVKQGRLRAAGSVEHMSWAMVGSIQVQVMRWAVFGTLDEPGLVRALRAAVELPWVARGQPASARDPSPKPPTATGRARRTG